MSRFLPWFLLGFRLGGLLLDRALVFAWRNLTRPLPRIDR